jgi:hypothetical protein
VERERRLKAREASGEFGNHAESTGWPLKVFEQENPIFTFVPSGSHCRAGLVRETRGQVGAESVYQAFRLIQDLESTTLIMHRFGLEHPQVGPLLRWGCRRGHRTCTVVLSGLGVSFPNCSCVFRITDIGDT